MNNTIKRTISGAGFVAIIMAALLLNKFIFAALMVFVETVMMLEFYRMTIGRKHILSQILAIASGLLLFALVFLNQSFGLSLKYLTLSLLPLMALMIAFIYKGKEEFLNSAYIYTSVLYIAVPLAVFNLIVFDASGFNGLLLLSFFIIIWASDVGAFIFGITLGKNGKKLLPAVSPKKSWVGFWGGIFSSLLASIILKFTGLLDFSLIYCIFLSIVMAVTGVFGDLFESQWKRCFDLKDSGCLIPGHGGLLDRFDSSLMAIPAGYLFLLIFNLI